MEEDLRLLFVEDLSSDYELAVREIKKEGLKFESIRVEAEDAFTEALVSFRPHLVISDYSMPAFDGTRALSLALEHDPFLPFIICTGSTNEETAVDCLKAGATDYVIKESLKRLPFAVKEALERRKILLQKEDTLRRLEESESQLKRAQTIANIGSWEMDFNTGLATASEEAKKIYGINQESVSIDLVKSMVLDQYRPLLDKVMDEHIHLGKPYDVEFQIMRASDQELRYIHSMAEYDPARNIVSGIIRDITEKKINESLRQEIIIANESTRFKQDFLAHMSHEIRTPLTAIGGLIEILEGTSLDPKQRDYLETIKFSSDSLQNIINEVLDFSKIEAGKMKINPVTFQTREIFIKSEKLFHSICKKQLSFEASGLEKLPKYISADRHRIFQIITNLISNAVKYSNHGKVLMEVVLSQVLDTDCVMLKVLVYDNGPGIHPGLRKELFKPFSQIHSNDDLQIEGTGLGLSICKELASLLGGEIDVESQMGKGSIFWFTFKAEIVNTEDHVTLMTQVDEAPDSTPLNILLAEDKSVNQKVISLLLNSLGHKVVIAKNGREAIETYQNGKFDLILMDIQMPVMDGITATQLLKAEFGDLPPIVGLSANAFEGDREKFIEQGLDEYLTKPVKGENFVDLIKRMDIHKKADDFNSGNT